MKPTSFKITSAISYLESEILKESGLSRTAFQRKAIDSFLQGNQKIDSRLKIRKRTDPNYVKKPVSEPIYLDKKREEKLLEVGAREDCGITIVLFQAMYDYCLECADLVSDDVLKNILSKE